MGRFRIAVASSGLGVVNRGIEAWARALAEGLYRAGVDVVLFHGGGEYSCPNVLLRYLRRTAMLARWISLLAPRASWRWDLTSTYGIEQRTFAAALLKQLMQWDRGILHTQDVVVAQRVERARRRGVTAVRVILAHGTNEPMDMLWDVEFVQHLCITELHRHREIEVPRRGVVLQSTAKEAIDDSSRRQVGPGEDGGTDFVIPNFVDTEKFCPEGMR